LRLAAQRDVREVLAGMNHQDEQDVQDDEDREGHHAEKMDAARGLPTAEQLDVPGEAGRDGRRHRRPGQDHDRPEHEHHEGVRELLQGVVGLEIAQRRHLEAEIGRQGAPGAGKNVPGCRNQAHPLPRAEEQGDVDDAGQQPQRIGDPVPMSSEPEVLVTRHRHPR
jgi:hypothetical protein